MTPARWQVRRGRTVSLGRPPAIGAEPIDALLIPGLVNAHAHLDLGGSPALPAQGSFPDWLLSVGGVRSDDRDVALEARRQARRLGARGVVAIGDIDASGGRGTEARRAAGLAGRSFLEIVGVSAPAARSRLAESLRVIDRLGGATILGLSPHAPYSVHEDVLPEIVRAAERRRIGLAMHLAESEEETRYLLTGDGPFRPFLEVIGKGAPHARPPGCRPVAYAEATGFLAAGGLVIHGNDLDDDDIERLARHAASVVYCHGTHRHFERPVHRFAELVSAGVNVALGTDSSASNDDVDLLGDMVRMAADRSDLSPLAILRAATSGGRTALGLDPVAARFGPGSVADGVLLASPPAGAAFGTAATLAAWVLSGGVELLATIHAGRAIDATGTPRPTVPTCLDSLPAHG